MAPADRDTELSSLIDELHRRRDSGTFDPEGVRTRHPDLGDEVLGLFETESALESAAQDWRGLLPAETASIVGANVETGAEATHGDDTSDEDGEPLPRKCLQFPVEAQHQLRQQRRVACVVCSEGELEDLRTPRRWRIT